MAIGKPIRPDGHCALLSDQGDRDALENRNPGGRPPEKCDKASAFLTEKLTQRDCKACDLIKGVGRSRGSKSPGTSGMPLTASGRECPPNSDACKQAPRSWVS